MKISVLIVAHNEEQHVARCIESLLAQTVPADEIVLISHNSTDSTVEIARTYPVRVVEYGGPPGPVYARIRGFEEVTGDIVLCIDGDAQAATNWVEVMTKMLMKPNMVMVGTWIKMSGTLYAKLGGYRWYLFCNAKGFKATDWLWGASFGVWARDREAVISALKRGVELSKQLHLAYNPDDYWLALFMSTHGDLEVTNKTWVDAHAKETSLMQYVMRGATAMGIRHTIRAFIKEGGLPGIRIQ
jgi:glycosyltransferase involved in cell wall biosynthesis